jgi:hypothetical protein
MQYAYCALQYTYGMVQANVGQKLVKKTKLQVFSMSDDEFLTLHLEIQMQLETTCPYVILLV